MIAFPNAKINLGLYVTEKRPDGYHNIESIFYPVAWHDILEIVPSSSDTKFSSSGIPIPGNSTTNLCLQAYELLNDVQKLPNIKIHLHKLIPIGAGLGGGSADGAFALKLLRDLFIEDMSNEELKPLALQLGSDCPFFIDNTPAYVQGTGDILESIKIDFELGTIVLANPGIHIGTKEAYAEITPTPLNKSLLEIIHQPNCWQKELRNDFEKPILENHPEINQLKTSFVEMGAHYVSMTGSGSTVYALFKDLTNFSEKKLNNSYIKVVR